MNNVIDSIEIDGLEIVKVKDLIMHEGRLIATLQDPWIDMALIRETRILLVDMEIDKSLLQPGDALRVYYSDDLEDYSENKCKLITIDNAATSIAALFFEKPVSKVRFDFTEREGVLPFSRVRIFSYCSIDKLLQDQVFNSLSAKATGGTVIVTHDLSKTGAPILAFNIAREMHKRGRGVLALHLGCPDPSFQEAYISEGIPLLPLFLLESASGTTDNSQLALSLLRHLNDSGYKSAILNTVVSGVYAGLFKQAGFKVVTLVHETAETITMHGWETNAREIAMFSDEVVFPCTGVRDGFLTLVTRVCGEQIVRPQGVYLDGTVAFANGADGLLAHVGVSQEDKLVLSSGTIELRKGTDLFLSAATSLCERYSLNGRKVHVFWVGDGAGELPSWLKIQLDGTQFQDRIHFIPFMDASQYKALLRRADVFWSTSRNDTFPSVVLEAMREGVPAVAFSGAVGVDAMLADGRGVLVDNFSAEAIAKETVEILEDASRASHIINLARQWVTDNLSFADYVDELCDMCSAPQIIDCQYVNEILTAGWDGTQLTPPLADAVGLESIRAIRKEFERAEHPRLFSGLFGQKVEKSHIDSTPVLLDVSLQSDNIGDHVIMDYCLRACSEALLTDRFLRVPTHCYDSSLESIRRRLKILCGTNLIYTHMERSSQWAFPHDLRNFDNLCMLGVGMQDIGIDEPFTDYSIELLHLLLDNKWLHSVRDEYTRLRLHEIGITNVVNTACPTMWGLTPKHCASIPKSKAPFCVATVTCHVPDAEADAYMLETLRSEYEHVFIWIQGPYDYDYCLRGVIDPTAFTILPPSLGELDRILNRDDIDYVGTRLHAGIRALNHGRRSLVVTVDNRARNIARDTGLPTVERAELKDRLVDWIDGSAATEIELPVEAIDAWKRQFGGCI